MASSCSREGLELIAGRIPSQEEWWKKLSREVKICHPWRCIRNVWM